MTCYHWLIFKSFQQTGMVWPSCLTKQPRVKLYLRVKKDHLDKANLRRVWFTVISFHVQIVPSQIVPLNSQIVPQKSQFVPHIYLFSKCVNVIWVRHRVKYGPDYFFDHFIGGLGSSPLALGDGWDAVYQYSIIQIILIGFSTDFFLPKFLRWARIIFSSSSSSSSSSSFFSFSLCECRTATQTLDLNCYWKYRVYNPPLLSYACGFWVDFWTISCFTFPFVYTVCNY